MSYDRGAAKIFLQDYVPVGAASNAAYNAHAPSLVGPFGSGNAGQKCGGSFSARCGGIRSSAEEAWLSSISEILRNYESPEDKTTSSSFCEKLWAPARTTCWAGTFVSATPTTRYPHGPTFTVGSSGLADARL
jgi:hypothetical protein